MQGGVGKHRSEDRQLKVLHRLKDRDEQTLPRRSCAFHVDTCLRELSVELISTRDEEDNALAGEQAYAFLLATAAGLNSAVPGETNVFGQFREAWKRQQQNLSTDAELTSLVSRLFSDVRHLRHNYLQGVGGNSYGTLVRKLLKPYQPCRLLFVGAGDMTAGILPLFSDRDTAVWNYRDASDRQLNTGRLFAPDDLDRAASWCDAAVMTTPPDDGHDDRWRLALSPDVPVIHLGRRRLDRGPWADHARLISLDDVFELRIRQSDRRRRQLDQARLACSEIARSGALAAALSR